MTDLQRQCLLSALGYYPHREIDGIWGPKSKSAMASFGADDSALCEAVSRLGEDIWCRVRNFTREEFRCKCGGIHCSGYPAQMDPVLLSLLDDIRDHFGAPAIISSGLRCEKHNFSCGGVSNSRHLSGKAADLMVLGTTAKALLDYALADKRTRYAYIIADGPYVHIDVA